jgi:homospermidine synthase
MCFTIETVFVNLNRSCHHRSTGANPGLVSWFVKQALLNLAKDTGYKIEKKPQSKEEWGMVFVFCLQTFAKVFDFRVLFIEICFMVDVANLMKNLEVKGIHIAERDTQRIEYCIYFILMTTMMTMFDSIVFVKKKKVRCNQRR